MIFGFVRTLLRLCCPVAVSCAGVAAAQPVPPQSAQAPEIRLTGRQVTLPIVMVREFPFIEGQVAGVRGRFMFDSGMEQALTLNDHRIPLQGGRRIGTGSFGSGQTYSVNLNPSVAVVRIGQLNFANATQVQSQDARMLEGITPDFLGWIGHHFWRGYAMKLDYGRLQATFYRAPSTDYLRGERVVGTIAFETRTLPNHPIVRVRIGPVDAVAAFDTGQYGTLYTDEPTRTRLIEAGALTPAADGRSFDLAAVEIAGRRLAGVTRMRVSTDPFPASEHLGIGERTVLTIGYGFLSHYRTVWDYRQGIIYLLAR